jgi:hypothetical protein
LATQFRFAAGVTPDQIAPQAYSCTDDIAQLRSAHPMKPALSLIRRLLVDDAIDSGIAVAIKAADGTLLWVEGDQPHLPAGRGDELCAGRRLE